MLDITAKNDTILQVKCCDEASGKARSTERREKVRTLRYDACRSHFRAARDERDVRPR